MRSNAELKRLIIAVASFTIIVFGSPGAVLADDGCKITTSESCDTGEDCIEACEEACEGSGEGCELNTNFLPHCSQTSCSCRCEGSSCCTIIEG